MKRALSTKKTTYYFVFSKWFGTCTQMLNFKMSST